MKNEMNEGVGSVHDAEPHPGLTIINQFEEVETWSQKDQEKRFVLVRSEPVYGTTIGCCPMENTQSFPRCAFVKGQVKTDHSGAG